MDVSCTVQVQNDARIIISDFFHAFMCINVEVPPVCSKILFASPQEFIYFDIVVQL